MKPLTPNSAFCLTLVLLALIVPAQAAPGQLVITADMQFSYARSCDTKKDFSTAAVEFKRFAHFFPDDPRATEAEFRAGLALFHQKRFHEAARQFDGIIRKGGTDEFTTESFFLQSRSFAAEGNTGYAQIILQNLLTLTRDQDVKDRAHLALARLHVKTAASPSMPLDPAVLDKIRQELDSISPGNAQAMKKQEHLELIDRVEDASDKSPVLAGTLALVPGGGFAYCGRYKDALVAFGLNGAMILAAYTAFDDGNPALGSVISFVGSGFYLGNIYGSASAAHKRNRSRQIRILDRMFEVEPRLDPENSLFGFSLSHPF